MLQLDLHFADLSGQLVDHDFGVAEFALFDFDFMFCVVLDYVLLPIGLRLLFCVGFIQGVVQHAVQVFHSARQFAVDSLQFLDVRIDFLDILPLRHHFKLALLRRRNTF